MYVNSELTPALKREFPLLREDSNPQSFHYSHLVIHHKQMQDIGPFGHGPPFSPCSAFFDTSPYHVAKIQISGSGLICMT